MAEYTLNFTGSEVDARLAAVPDAVKFITQSLTSQQKAQARTNIGATSFADLASVGSEEYVVVTSLPSATASTLGRIYLVGPTDDEYQRWISSFDGSAYSWVNIGSTNIPSPVIADNLTTDDAAKALSAKQGKYLYDNGLFLGDVIENNVSIGG